MHMEQIAKTCPLRAGDIITVTFPGWPDCIPGYTVSDSDGTPRWFEVLEQNGVLGIMYPDSFIGHGAERFTPFDEFAYNTDFGIVQGNGSLFFF